MYIIYIYIYREREKYLDSWCMISIWLTCSQATLALMPLMAPGGRVVIVASSLAELAIRWMNEEAFTKLFSAASTEKVNCFSLYL